nr:T9SS type A sorting domain-containing protein [Desulfobacula sp.]
MYLRPKNYCATPDEDNKWLRTYQEQPHLYEKGNNELVYIPMTIHLLGTDEGQGFFVIRDLLDALCVVNDDFASSNIQFFIKDIRYIKRTAWYNHDNFTTGAEMRSRNNVVNTMNCYFVSNAANACGYANINSIAVVVQNSCSNSGERTWSHELGHALSLPHTFRGWEESSDYDFKLPAPKYVKRGNDSILVELLDKSNCEEAGDRFCDTQPDYLSNRWNCTGMQRSSIQQIDPNGMSFTSDGSFIMGYSDDNCQSRFSLEQIQAMRANIFSQKVGLINRTISDAPIEANAPITLTLPENNQSVGFQNIFFEWLPVTNATNYILQVSRLPTFSVLELDTIITATNLTIKELPSNRRYYWRILPYNNYSTCNTFSSRNSFTTVLDATATINLDERQVTVTPTLLAVPGYLQIELKDIIRDDLRVELYDITGQLVMRNEYGRSFNNTLQIPIENHSSGIYLLRVVIANQQFVRKIVLE